MKRLDIILPEWTRKIWASAAAQSVWQQRLQEINAAWCRMERWSVVDGARGSCLTFVEPQDLMELTRWGTKSGILVLPMAMVGLAQQYAAAPTTPLPNEKWQYRVILCQQKYRDAWFEAWQDGRVDHELVGKLLEFPECCRKFFQSVWIDQKFLDTTWPMAVGTRTASKSRSRPQTILLDKGRDDCNILLRWLGVRAVTHLPCSFDCEPTIELAKMYAQIAKDRHFTRQYAHIREMLSWPVEWSALHGIAEIKTPILKISSRTDMTVDKYLVQKEGNGYPAEGSFGLVFPFKNKPGQVKLTASKAFARSFSGGIIPAKEIMERLEAAHQKVVAPTEDLWTDNGFTSFDAMNAAHDVLLEAAGFAGLQAGDTALDLGCGNGQLLECLGKMIPGLDLYGIEQEAERCQRGGERLRARGRQILIYEGNMFHPKVWPEPKGAWDLVFFMPGRLTEFTVGDAATRAKELRTLLYERVKHIVFYAYGDWLRRGGLPALMRKVKLGKEWRIEGEVIETPNATAWLAVPRKK